MSRAAGLWSPLSVPPDPPVGLHSPSNSFPTHGPLLNTTTTPQPPRIPNKRLVPGPVFVFISGQALSCQKLPLRLTPCPAPRVLQRAYTEQGCARDRPSRGRGWKRMGVPSLIAACTPSKWAGHISPLLPEGLLRSQVAPLACFSSSVGIPTFSLPRPGVRATATPLQSSLSAPTSPQAAGSRESVPGPPFPCALSEWGLREGPAMRGPKRRNKHTAHGKETADTEMKLIPGRS